MNMVISMTSNFSFFFGILEFMMSYTFHCCDVIFDICSIVSHEEISPIKCKIMDIEYRITFLIAKITVINLIVDENGHDFLKQSNYYKKYVEKKANKELVSLGIVLIHLLNSPSNSANFLNSINHGLFPKIKKFNHKKFSTKNKYTYKKKV